MGFASESGYTPATVEDIMNDIMGEINTQFGTTYTYEQFVGTNFYKYFYALAQRVQSNEVKTSEIFSKLQQFIEITNERISRPVVTNPGLVDALSNYESELLPDGLVASVKPMIEADAGKINICVDIDETLDNYAALRAEICELIKDSTVAGAVTFGSESESIVLSNGQSFDFKYHLPNRIPVALRLTLTLSENNQSVIDSPEDIKATLLLNIANRYRLGKNFEPQKYFSSVDAPWASVIVLEWTDDVTDGEIDETPTWNDDVYDADFDDLFVVDLALTELVEN
jgi:hypothetical protein